MTTDPTAFPAWAADLRTQVDRYERAVEASMDPPRGMEAFERFGDLIVDLDYIRVMAIIDAVADGLDVVGPTDMQYRLMHIGYLVIGALGEADHFDLVGDLEEWNEKGRP